MSAFDEDRLRRLVQERLSEAIVAAGAFHWISDAPFGALTTGAAAIGIVSHVGRLAARTRARFPTYPYVALTASELVVTEFRFGSSIRIKRLVGRWPLSSIEVLAAEPARRRMSLRLRDRRQVDLEGLYGSGAEGNVVTRMRARLAGENA